VKSLKSVSSMLVLMALAFVALVAAPPAEAQKSYNDATGGFLNETTFVTSAAYTTGATATPADIGAYASGVIVINVTVVSGTSPSLTVNFQTCFTPPGTGSAPATSNCVIHTAGTAITATGIYFIKVDHFARWNTVNYAITGTTPSFTFSVVGYFKPTS
jgi:hypothetical protein